MRNLIKHLLTFNLLILFFSSKAENINFYFPLLDSLMLKKQWKAANELCSRMNAFADDSIQKDILIKQGMILLEMDMPYEGYECFKKVFEDKYSNPQLRSKAVIYSALSFIQMEEYTTALYFIEIYPTQEVHKKIRNILSGYCYYMLKDFEAAKENFYNAGIHNYQQLLDKRLYKLKRLKLLSIISSSLLPGSGQLLLGKPFDAASALTINIGLGFLLIRASAISTIGTILFTTPLFTRYYVGNIARTVQFADDKIVKFKKNNIKKILIDI